MTEAEWLACDDPVSMLGWLGERVSDRRARLVACACCRRLWHLLADGSKRAVEVTERYADGRATSDDLWDAYHAAEEAVNMAGYVNRPVHRSTFPDDQFDVLEVVDHAAELVGGASDLPSPVELAERAAQSQIVREVFGNPFRPAKADWVWQTPTIGSLALAAYDERALPSGDLDLHHLAILSDALEEVGCNDVEILSHLRSAGPHVRGCWALDLILGKS